MLYLFYNGINILDYNVPACQDRFFYFAIARSCKQKRTSSSAYYHAA